MATKGLTDLKLDSRVQAALEAVRDRLMARHPVDRIVLYGSVAWGRPDDESDVDLLIVLKDPPDHDIEDQISRVILEINLEYDTNLSELIVDRDTWERGVLSGMPIHEEIENHGIRL